MWLRIKIFCFLILLESRFWCVYCVFGCYLLELFHEDLLYLHFQGFVSWVDCWVEGYGWPHYYNAPTTIWCFACPRSDFLQSLPQCTVLFSCFLVVTIVLSFYFILMSPLFVCPWLSFIFEARLALSRSWYCLSMFYLDFSLKLSRYSWWLESHYQADWNVYFHGLESRASFLHE